MSFREINVAVCKFTVMVIQRTCTAEDNFCHVSYKHLRKKIYIYSLTFIGFTVVDAVRDLSDCRICL